MTDRRTHLLTAVPVALAALLAGWSPLAFLPLAAGALLPELDALDADYHRSWALHTFLAPALAYLALVRLGLGGTAAVDAVHFASLGVAVHLAGDFGYPRSMTHDGAAWPVRPEPGDYWGLVLLGVSWAVQWFLYLAPAFLPWLVGAQ